MTVDSGNHWNAIFPDPFDVPDYLTIRFYNERIGYATDGITGYGHMRVYRTTDSGYHWKESFVTPYECSNILFRPDSTIILAGIYGSIVSRDIADYGIDSVQVIPGICGAQFKAKVSAFLSPVDSVWFQYGKNVYTDMVSGNPVRVADTSLRITATASNLQPDSIYHVGVKIKFRGNYYYSTDVNFRPNKATAPVITVAGNVLSSSVTTGNQWYFDGTIIPGATNQQYTATASGSYTVTAVQNNCPTLASAAFNLTVTATPDINAWGREIQIYPNPIENDEVNVIVHTNRRLILQITDITGRLAEKQELKNGINKLSLPELQSGMYVFIIRDAKTFETVKRMVLKF